MELQSHLSQTASIGTAKENRFPIRKQNRGASPLTIEEDELAFYSVVISDRDAMSSALLASALTRDQRCQASAVRSAELIQYLAKCEINVAVIGADLAFRSGSGLDLAEEVGRHFPNVLLVILLNETTQEAVVRAFRAGARGVFSREQPIAEFLDCADHVRKGYIWAGAQESQLLLQAFRSVPMPGIQAGSNIPELTSRELQVVQCAAKGKTNKAIASELGLSEHTIKNYLFRSFEKLGVSSRVELLFYLTHRGQVTKVSDLDEADVNEQSQAS